MARARLFMSFRYGFVAGDWVAHAGARLKKWFDVYDYRQLPETDPNLRQSLRQQIARSDVFVCVLNEQYLGEETTRGELEDAIELPPEKNLGSLKDAQPLPLIYIVTCDSRATEW